MTIPRERTAPAPAPAPLSVCDWVLLILEERARAHLAESLPERVALHLHSLFSTANDNGAQA
jgi:hypothetical protein